MTKKIEKSIPNKGGRPQKLIFNETLLSCIEQFAKEGKTDEEIAEILSVSVRTLYRYKNRISKFCHALKQSKNICDDLVEQSLLDKALGYSLTEETEETNAQGEIIKTKKEKQVYGDTTAMIFWLKNRRPKEWRDKVEHEHGGSDNPIQLAYDPTKRLTNNNKEEKE